MWQATPNKKKNILELSCCRLYPNLSSVMVRTKKRNEIHFQYRVGALCLIALL